MNFNSLQFLIFLPTVVVLYYILPKKLKNLMLLAASYFFYMCWNPAYALLMLTSTFVTYLSSRLMASNALGKKRLWLILSFIINIGILFFFKYFNFVSVLIYDVLHLAGLSYSPPLLNILLPMGISFYTFQALGYTLDVYREDIPVEKNFAIYALFVSFFPQLVAGPIERTGNLLPQLKKIHPFRSENIKEGILPILWGLFKKIIIADQFAVLIETVYGNFAQFNGFQLTVATVAFAIQIYCDFSAYSDIARGSAAMLGIRLMHNFNRPYFAVSIQDFWRRWHISLSTWFKDYLYFPLGGSRKGKVRTQLNIIIVFLVSGLWHGAALTYVVWGFLNGIYQVIGNITAPLKKRMLGKIRINHDSAGFRLFSIILTFILTCSTWVFFRATSITEALQIGKKIVFDTIPPLFTSPGITQMGLPISQMVLLLISTTVLFVVDFVTQKRDIATAINKTVVLRYTLYFVVIMILLIFGAYGQGYDPQDFVYFQF